MRARLNGSIVVLLAVAVAAGCADATGPESDADVTGAWSGAFSHPSYDSGSLSMSLLDVNGEVSGTYRLRLVRSLANGRNYVQASGGQVTGSSANGRLNLRLSRTDEDWLLEGRLSGANRANGEWSTLRGVRGSFDIER